MAHQLELHTDSRLTMIRNQEYLAQLALCESLQRLEHHLLKHLVLYLPMALDRVRDRRKFQNSSACRDQRQMARSRALVRLKG